ncbi:phosphopantetheine-binding protein [Pseudomonas izuensis]|uniref:phosphopantetheine-binding protein n=1 Tax=Pseudomonas izuensis TaxID=2684212 RepID=UPI001356B876|nr:phosphopantetheine-binding protein [Pseudomonas izuensis]
MSKKMVAELEVECQVIKVLSDYFPAVRWKIELGSRLVEDLCVDSISLVEIVMSLNDSFGIELPEVGVEEWRSVLDIYVSVKESVSHIG